MDVADLLSAGIFDGPALSGAVDRAAAEDVAAVCALASHPDPRVRAATARELPLMLGGEPPAPAAVDAVTGLTRDPDPDVRDWACFALGVQWREVDTPEVRQALAERLHDEHTDTRCEALVGLAHRQDARALPAVREALSRPDGGLRWLELEAAGALSDPSLHELVLRHLDGWDDVDRLRVEAVRRLTDPAGTGDDLIEGVAELYRRRTHGRAAEDVEDVLPAWHQMSAVLDINPRLAPRLLAEVAAVLDGDALALEQLRSRSALAQLAAEVDDGRQ